MSKKRNGEKIYSQRITSALKVKFLFLGTLVGLSVAGLAAVIVTSMNKSKVVHDSSNYHPATFAVAEKFMCGCPDCDLELIECECNHSGGGVYELYYISERLKEGLSEEETVNAVQTKFGRIKSKYQDLVNLSMLPKEERSK